MIFIANRVEFSTLPQRVPQRVQQRVQQREQQGVMLDEPQLDRSRV